MATATLDSDFLPERVVVKNGANTTEFVYGNFQDFNNPLFKIEALYPAPSSSAATARSFASMKAKVTEIGQVYVIMPVPDSVQKAAESEDCDEGDHGRRSFSGLSLLATPVAAQFGAPPPPADPNAPAPKLADGQPDLTRLLAGRRQNTGSGIPGLTVGGMFRRCTPFQNKNCMEWTNQSEDWPFMSTSRLDHASAAVQARVLGQDHRSRTSGRTGTIRS